MAIPISPKQFVILSQPRGGTHFLRGLLNSHPNLHCFGEVFQHGNLVVSHPELAETGDARAIVKGLLTGGPDDPRKGFIVQDDQRAGVAPYRWTHHLLSELDPPPLLIWLRRRNVIAQLASWFTAMESRKWMRFSEKTSVYHLQGGSLQPNPVLAARRVIAFHQRRERLKQELGHLPGLNLLYEDLADHPQTECERIFEKLEVAPHAVTPNTHRQRTYRLPHAFANYGQILAEISKQAHANGIDIKSLTRV